MRQIVLEEDLNDDEEYGQQSDGEADASIHTRDDISEEAEDEEDDDDDQDTERRESTVTIEQAQAQHEAEEQSDSDEGASPPISALSSGLRGVAIKSAAGRPPIRLVRQEHPLKTEQTAGDSEDEDDDDDDDDDELT